MKQIEIEFGGVTFTATLHEDKAPKTVAALWKILPIDDPAAVHAMWSGEMFHLTPKIVDLGVQEVENAKAYQWPGEIVFYPPIQEIAICYGEARFTGPIGPLRVTGLGMIEGQLDLLKQKASALHLEGKKRIIFRRKGA
ncbi:MAG TPA: cyclophilin-like fold protein [Candidatus Acidoferrum sp.]|nr:cyclophilin-like fold protein [Candidatus Acidoferrum sp.]